MTPLHQAVLNGDEVAVRKYSGNKECLSARDSMGFTPLQLARLLGKRDFQKLLGGTFPKQIMVQSKGVDYVVQMSLNKFESAFHFAYSPFLLFSSYEQIKKVRHLLPHIFRSHFLAAENYAWGKRYGISIDEGWLASVYVKWIDEQLGYGLFAAEDMAAGTFVGEFTGLVRSLSKKHPDHNGYCLHYPTRFWSWEYFAVDGLSYGNLTRFINHSDLPNLKPVCAIKDRLLHQVFVTNEVVLKDAQLTVNYGDDYWLKRKKQPI